MTDRHRHTLRQAVQLLHPAGSGTSSCGRRRAAAALLATALAAARPCAAHAGGETLALTASALPWTLSVYGGRWIDSRLIEILSLQASREDLRSSYFASLALGRPFARPILALQLEFEAQLLQHWGKQSHTEAAAALMLRWMHFPWNAFVHTSVAFGEGLALAAENPRIENRGKSRRLLNLLITEVTVSPRAGSPWTWVARIHHRSGALGTFGGVRGGSNFIALGLRYEWLGTSGAPTHLPPARARRAQPHVRAGGHRAILRGASSAVENEPPTGYP